MQRKPIFDTVREMLGRGFTQSEVAMLDAAIDRALSEDDPAAREVSEAGIDLIKHFEGCARLRSDGMVEAYPDPGTGGAPWTIGWGATGAGIDRGTVWTREQCDERLAADVRRHAQDVVNAIGAAATTIWAIGALITYAVRDHLT